MTFQIIVRPLYKAIFFCSILQILILHIGTCELQGMHFDLLCEIKDLESKQPISPRTVYLDIGGKMVNLDKIQEGKYKYAGSLEKIAEVYKLNIENFEEYESRELSLRLKKPYGKKEGRTVKNLFVKKKVEPTDDFLYKGKLHLDIGELEEAYAIYDYAYRRVGQTPNWYLVRVKYNYARTLLELCKSQNYNTCHKAFGLFEELLKIYVQHEEIFRKEGIKKVMLEQGIKDCQATEIIAKFSKISSFYATGDYMKAAELAEEGIEARTMRPTVFDRVGLTERRLLIDAATSYLKEVEKREKEGIVSEENLYLLNKSKAHFQKLETAGKLRGRAEKDYKIIIEKVNKYY